MQNIKVFTGNSNPDFAKAVTNHLNIPLGVSQVDRFADGEVQVFIKENVRGTHVFIIQSTCPPVNENYMEVLILIDALKRASVQEITLVMPYYGYARQDCKSQPRTPISARLVAELCKTAGVTRLLVVDLHTPQIQGFFDGPVDNLMAFPVMARIWKKKHPRVKNVVCVSPDAGGVERAQSFAKRINSPIAVIDKRRWKPGVSRVFHVIGDIKGKTAIIIDDMIDTAGTLCNATQSLLDQGAQEVYAMGTHGLFSGSAIAKVAESQIKELWVTDTIPPLPQEKQIKDGRFRRVSVAPLVAEAIKRIYDKGSISALFD